MIESFDFSLFFFFFFIHFYFRYSQTSCFNICNERETNTREGGTCLLEFVQIMLMKGFVPAPDLVRLSDSSPTQNNCDRQTIELDYTTLKQ